MRPKRFTGMVLILLASQEQPGFDSFCSMTVTGRIRVGVTYIIAHSDIVSLCSAL